ncbi:YfhO family protein, partial [Candidatus Sumerlaeota bacterium]|nr:YfhO family protein [Candidatus Sumerlaeota bacterium]
RLPVSTDMSMMYAPFYSLHWEGGIFGVPLWNPHLACGMALDGNLQFSALYPLRWPFYFVHDWRSWFGQFMFAHYLLALGGSYGALRSLGFGKVASLGGAVLFSCGGYMAARIINTTIFLASCWFPWLIWGAAERRVRGGLLCALAISMIILIGSPHLMIYGSTGFGIAWLILNPPLGNRETKRASLLRLIYFALGIVIGLPALVPGFVQIGGSIRTETSLENNLADSLRWSEIPGSLFGGAGGIIYPEINDKCLYLGGAAAALILLAAARIRNWRDRRWWCGIALTLAGLTLALGKNIGWQYIMPYIPGFRLLEGPARALILSAFGLAMLAATGLENLAPGNPPLNFSRRVAASLSLVALAVIVPLRLHPSTAEFKSFGDLMAGWLAVPGSVIGPLFAAVDFPLTALAALAAFWGAPAVRLNARWGLLALLILNLAHFAPRVAPRAVEAEFFDPPPQVRFLMEQKKSSGESGNPFRIAAMDCLQSHDTEWDNLHKISYLMPNLATLYGLEDIRAFDPLIPRPYKSLFLSHGGQAPYNDPIRNLEIGRPDPELFRMLNVRYFIGNPYDRRLTNLPMALTPQVRTAEVKSWEEVHETEPITAWRFVSLCDGAANLTEGDEVANLELEADEGRFNFPVRYGIETAHLLDAPEKLAGPNAQANMSWTRFTGGRAANFRARQTNFRATIEFGKPLHVRRAAWRLTRSDLIFFIASQAYRLAPLPQDPNWREAFADPVAPIFEFLKFEPRFSLFRKPGEVPSSRKLNLEYLEREAESKVSIISAGPSRITCAAESPGSSVFVARQAWSPNWHATVDGHEAQTMRVNGVFMGIEVGPGGHRVEFYYRPALFYWLAGMSVLVFLSLIGLTLRDRRRG